MFIIDRRKLLSRDLSNIMDNRVFDLYNALFIRYGHQNWWPVVENGKCYYLDDYRMRPRTPAEILEIMIGSILTQNTSWENAANAISQMKYNSLMSVGALVSAGINDLAAIIKGSGYYNQKSKKIAALVKFLGEVNGGIEGIRSFSLPDARRMFLSVWGIGRETADSILLYGFYYLTFVIDAYTLRVFSRVGIRSAKAGYDALQQDIIGNIPPDRLVYQDFHALLVLLGKTVCRKKPLCGICVLSYMCDFAKSGTGYAQGRT